MKPLFYILPLILLLTACADGGKYDPTPDNPYSDPTEMSQAEKNSLYQDTITPPSNPLVPPTDNTYTVKGVLVTQNYGYGIFPALRTLNTQTTYYLMVSSREFAHFDNPLLSGLRIGDVIAVTGEPFRLVANQAYRGILMTEVHFIPGELEDSEEGKEADDE